MSLGSAGILSTGNYEKHLIHRKQKKNKAKASLLMVLMLTSMVDMFSILVCFLLQTYSASPETMVTKGVSLPMSQTVDELKEAPLISIAQDEVFFNNKSIGKLTAIMDKPDLLALPLVEERKKWVSNHPDKPFDGLLNFQADKSIPSTTIARIMGIANGGQYYQISLAVISGGDK